MSAYLVAGPTKTEKLPENLGGREIACFSSHQIFSVGERNLCSQRNKQLVLPVVTTRLYLRRVHYFEGSIRLNVSLPRKSAAASPGGGREYPHNSGHSTCNLFVQTLFQISLLPFFFLSFSFLNAALLYSNYFPFLQELLSSTPLRKFNPSADILLRTRD